MKNYRCVFIYAGGNTTISVMASNGEHAIEVATAAISVGDYNRVEVWEGRQLLLTQSTPRAWGLLGDDGAPERPARDPAGPELPQGQPASSHPRRAPSSIAASLKGVDAGLIRRQRKAGHKG